MITHRGDSIIEVLLAVTVFSLVAVGALVIMNQGVDTAQRAVELTQVKLQVDSQVEALRSIHQKYAQNPRQEDNPLWKHTKLITAITPSPNPDTSKTCTVPTGAFAMNIRTGGVIDIDSGITTDMTDSPEVFAGTWYSSPSSTDPPKVRGIWIETLSVQAGTSTVPGSREYKVVACWPVPGSPVPQTTSTIVRLYEP